MVWRPSGRYALEGLRALRAMPSRESPSSSEFAADALDTDTAQDTGEMMCQKT